MTTGTIIKIIESTTITNLKLQDLVGRMAEVVEICYNKEGGVKGVWAELDEPYLDEIEWFFPSDCFVIDEPEVAFVYEFD